MARFDLLSLVQCSSFIVRIGFIPLLPPTDSKCAWIVEALCYRVSHRSEAEGTAPRAIYLWSYRVPVKGTTTIYMTKFSAYANYERHERVQGARN